VSKSLVSMVIRGDEGVSPERREAVLEAISDLNYRPNAMARGLVQRRTRIVGVMISNFRNPFFGDVVAGIQHEAAEFGYKVLFSTGDRQHDLEEAAIESLLELRVDGLIFASSRIDDRAIVRLGRTAPLVVLNRQTTDVSSDSVTNDNQAGAELAVEHCASLGHTRIAHIAGGTGVASQERRVGYERAMRRLGLADHIVVVDGAFTEAGGHLGARELLDQPVLPTAVFAANDLCAIGALNALEEAGKRIPDDVSIVGYDNTSLAALRHVSLSSIHQPGEEMGRMAVDCLFERIHEGRTEPRHDVISPSLVVRSTTASPPVASGVGS
jgi:DNA-binding LacI/PurR family transcriptional regulator